MASNSIDFQIHTIDNEPTYDCITMIAHNLYENINILLHNATGNYFITGVAKAYNDKKESEFVTELSKIPSLREDLERAKTLGNVDDVAFIEAQLNNINELPKPLKVDIRVWLRLEATKKFLNNLKTEGGYTDEQVAFRLTRGPVKFRGIYVHKFALNKFLDWMDPCYAIKVAQLLDRYLVEQNEKLKLQLKEAQKNETNAEKRYKKLNKRFDEQAKQLKDQYEKTDKLIGYANALTSQNQTLIDSNQKLQITTDTTQEQLEQNLTYTRQALLMLEERSLAVTMSSDPKLITHYAILVPKNIEATKTRTMLVRGQMSRISDVINENEDEYTSYTLYSANNVNLFINAQARYQQMLSEYIIAYNEPINERNKQLALEINEHNNLARNHNKTSLDDQMSMRFFNKEKESLLCKKDIPINFGRTFITYEPNPHFTYEQVINCIETIRLG